jgi:phage tail-like protein
MADAKSSYLQYLPKALWESEPPLPAFSLGATLRIFEKVLTGINDNAAIIHGDHEHPPVAETIARLPEVVDPWRTRPDLLPWLAQWVALELPDAWTEYQRRRATSAVADVYSRRGRRDGIQELLELYAGGSPRPRVLIDDGTRILAGRLGETPLPRLTALVTQGPAVRQPAPPPPPAGALAPVLDHAGPVDPLAIARAPDGSLLLADAGTPPASPLPIAPAIWRVSETGAYAFAGLPAVPVPITPAGGWTLREPVALVVDSPPNPTTTTPWRLWVLDRVDVPTDVMLYRLDAPAPDSSVFTLGASFTQAEVQAAWPVALTLAPSGRLFVIDRGRAPGAPFAPVTMLELDPAASPPLVATRVLTVAEPVSAVMRPGGGSLVIGDARAQNTVQPADLVSVDLATGAETSLLGGLAANPLVCPHALLARSDTAFLVGDGGLKPFRSGQGALRRIAAMPALYDIDVAGPAPVVTRACRTGDLVFPVGLAWDGETVFVADRGHPTGEAAWWRLYPSRFGVLVHFLAQPASTGDERRVVLAGIRDLIERERPGHTAWTLSL